MCSGENYSLWLSLGDVGREPDASFPSHLHSNSSISQAGALPDLWVQHLLMSIELFLAGCLLYSMSSGFSCL